MPTKLPARAHRAGEIVSAPDDSREVEISFSSEARVKRNDLEGDAFLEVLGHGDGEMDLARLNGGAAPLLKDHMPTLDAQIGVVVRAWVAEGRGRAVVRFSTSPAAEDVLSRVRSGDVTCVSVGYGISQAKRDGQAEGLPVVRITRWTPREISFVAIPADTSVGYGRAEPGDGEPIEVTQQETAMPPEDTDQTETRTAPKPTPAAPDNGDAVRSALEAERTRTGEIEAIAETFSAHVTADDVRSAKSKGTTPDAFRKIVLDKMGSAQAEATRAGATRIGLTDQEARSFSMVRLLRHLSNPEDGRFRKDAGFELEAVRAATDSHKGQVRGVIVPSDVMQAEVTRASDQVVGVPAKGGNVVDEVLMSGSMIDILRATSVLPRLGARMFTGLRGDIAFPKQLSDVAYTWIAEDGSATQSGVQFGQVKMTPKTISAWTEISRRMLVQSSVDIEAFLRASIMAQIALGGDTAALNDTADENAPRSLASYAERPGSQINRVSFSADGPTYREAVNMRTRVKKQNALMGNLAYTFDPTMEEHFLTTPKFEGGDLPIMAEEGRLGGYRALASNQIAEGKSWFGNWSDFYVGLWSGLDITVDPYSKSTEGAVRIIGHQDMDFAPAREQSFTLGEVEGE